MAARAARAADVQPSSGEEGALGATVRACVESYLADLDGHEASGLYHLVLGEVERPLLAAVLAHTAGNLTRAAAVLGVSRATLRKKLRHHGLAG